MAYDHYQTSHQAGLAASVASTSVLATTRWHIGYQPVVIQAVALVVTTALTGSGEIIIRHRPTPGSASGQVVIATITTGAHDVGDVVYVDGLSYRVPPGSEVVAEVTNANTAGAGTLSYFYHPAWDSPSNHDNMADGSA